MFNEDDTLWMARAIELAARGQGLVEPNPLVGCVIVRDRQVIGEGWHAQFGGPHAEVAALRSAGERGRNATMYVTLEPCCHQGKTPPCTQAIIAAGIKRVICAMRDPFPQVAGGGFAELSAAGISVETGLLATDVARLNQPYLKLLATGLPWVIAKWAMTLDGKIASHSGDSQWISGETSRQTVHQLRGRVDAIVIGGGTAKRDNPLLTARPAGPRAALRVVLDSKGHLSSQSQLLETARQVPLLIVVSSQASANERERLQQTGAEVVTCDATEPAERMRWVMQELGRRRCTNVLVEGGSRVLGSLLDADLIDEVWAFVAPKLIGGFLAPSPIAGTGQNLMSQALTLCEGSWRSSGDDLLYVGQVKRAVN